MILITGASGQLGFDVIKVCEERELEYIKTDTNELDITDISAIKVFFDTNVVDIVIHCAAYTAVDLAEDEIDKCNLVNITGTENLAKICNEKDIKLLYLSTDYVFDGLKLGNYDVYDQPNPQSVYGRSKLLGEIAIREFTKKHFIVRISWVYGLNGKNFVKTMLRIGKINSVINVVSDQVGSPTYTKDIAPLLIDIALSDKYGTYHATNEGFCSWYEFACAIFEEAKYNVQVNPIESISYPTKAKRPLNSKLSKSKLIESNFYLLPDWRNGLKRYIAELKENNEL